MAKKKTNDSTVAIKIFKDVMLKASCVSYYHVNNILLNNHSIGNVVIIPGKDLWGKLILEDEFKSSLSELDLTSTDQRPYLEIFKYAAMNDLSWFNVEITEDVVKNKIFNIVSEGMMDMSLGLSIFPFRFLKAHMNNISYTLVRDKNAAVLLVKKKFDPPDGLDGEYGFEILRAFNVLQ